MFFLRIILLQTPRPDPEGSMIGLVKEWTLEHWTASGMNAAYALADYSQD